MVVFFFAGLLGRGVSKLLLDYRAEGSARHAVGGSTAAVSNSAIHRKGSGYLHFMHKSVQFLARFKREAFERAIGREGIEESSTVANVIWYRSAKMITHGGL